MERTIEQLRKELAELEQQQPQPANTLDSEHKLDPPATAAERKSYADHIKTCEENRSGRPMDFVPYIHTIRIFHELEPAYERVARPEGITCAQAQKEQFAKHDQ